MVMNTDDVLNITSNEIKMNLFRPVFFLQFIIISMEKIFRRILFWAASVILLYLFYFIFLMLPR